MILPFGLGIKFIKTPIVTLLLIIGCFAFYFTGHDNSVEKEALKIHQSKKLLEAKKKLFIEYCLAEGVAPSSCKDTAKQIDNKAKGKKNKLKLNKKKNNLLGSPV